MKQKAIVVENLSKCYRIGLREQIHDTLGGAFFSWLSSPYNNLKELRKLSHFKENETDEDIIWALKDISFEVKEGEVIGIIGANGAGKSTLLKILSSITEPTSGRAIINGRVSSLLEVGTGFHPELSGRENIYLNGTILGMTKKEIDSKFDEIVDFSGVEKFIDTPIKRYSSGMKVRLAFSVAAHLEPEILLIDEVLAVGDIEFQKKCLGKMSTVAKAGRTVLFVSHNMSAVNRLCERAILLHCGSISALGFSERVIEQYIRASYNTSSSKTWKIEEAPGNAYIRLDSVRVIDKDLNTIQSLDIRNPVGIEIIFAIIKKKYKIIPSIALFNSYDIHVFNAIDIDKYWDNILDVGKYKCISWIPGNFFSEGNMFISIVIFTASSKLAIRHVDENAVVTFQVFDKREGDSAIGTLNSKWEKAACRPLLDWNHKKLL